MKKDNIIPPEHLSPDEIEEVRQESKRWIETVFESSRTMDAYDIIHGFSESEAESTMMIMRLLALRSTLSDESIGARSALYQACIAIAATRINKAKRGQHNGKATA